jgi:hypothetical protein
MGIWMKTLFHFVFMVVLAVISTVHLSTAEEVPLKGFVDSFGYGYEVSISVNGTPVKAIKGDGQQATRLYGVDHPMRTQSPPEMADLFILNEGENTIAVEFKKKGDSQNALQIKVEMPDRYAKPLFHLTSSKLTSGKVEKKFVIEKTAPETFTTIEVNDDNL